ncbi:MAG: right-handed parallel beta-helix repeat-containing protein, partial [Azospirillaceae bacterium]|nr:right-handed parallel beta-helix repeat-containing protein [Azospirillaceae bacterium]
VANAYNDGFVTIAAETGQTPVFSSLVVEGAAKWIFQGITVQNSNAKTLASALVLINGLSWEGPTTDIIVQNNNIMVDSTAAVAGWTLADWTTRAAGTALATRGVCTTIQNNYIHNVRAGVTIYLANQATVHGNVINNFTDDGIDINGSDVTVTRNTITNHHWTADGLHPDCIQGQSLAASLGTAYTAVNKNILIDSNVCIRHTDSTLPDTAGDYLQGITVFDGHWQNWTATNNVIVTNAWEGMAVFGVDGAKIVNNTVLGTDPAIATWIHAAPMKAYEGNDLPVANVIRNNIAMRYTNDGPQKTAVSGVTLDHNIIATVPGQLYKVETTKNTDVGPGTEYPDVVAKPLQKLVVTFLPTAVQFDLHLASASAAIGAGSITLAPARDLDNAIRVAPVNNGAYGRAP